MLYNGLGYEQLRGLALSTFDGTHQAENPCGFSEIGENKQLLIEFMKKTYVSAP